MVRSEATKPDVKTGKATPNAVRRDRMAEHAINKMTVAEFVRWEDGSDTRYELLDGTPVAMTPPAVAHGMLSLRLGARIEAALRARPRASVKATRESLGPAATTLATSPISR